MRRKNAFTLVELLVVIGIIALLIGILLPSLRKARDAAQKTACLSNLRQLTMAWTAYATDNKGKLVVANTDVPPTNDPYNAYCTPWALGNNTEQGLKDGALYMYMNAIPPYRCPSDSTPNLRTYSINAFLNGEYPNNASPLPGCRHKLAEIKRPSEVLVFIEEFDNRGYNINSFWIPASGDSFIDIPAFFHRGVCMSFVDGHCDFMPYADSRTYLLTNGTPGATFPNNKDLKQLQYWSGENFQ